MMKKAVCEVNRWMQLKSLLNNLSPAQFREAMQTEGNILIDVRTAEEYRAAHLGSALNLDYLSYEFWDQIEELDPTATYLVYCRSARRSIRACTLMRNGGFEKVFHLEGGLIAWQEAFGKIGK